MHHISNSMPEQRLLSLTKEKISKTTPSPKAKPLPVSFPPPAQSQTAPIEKSSSKICAILFGKIERPHSDLSQNLLPSRFNLECSPKYIRETNKMLATCFEIFKHNQQNTALHQELAIYSLLSAEIYRYKRTHTTHDENKKRYFDREKELINEMRAQIEEIRAVNPFSAFSYYAESLLMEYHGVDCLNLKHLEKYILLLNTAKFLDEDDEDINRTYKESLEFIEERWERLREEEILSSSAYLDHIKKKDRWTATSPKYFLYKVIIKYHDLSKHNKYGEYYRRYQQTNGFVAFCRMYYYLKTVCLDGNFTLELLKEKLKFIENSHFICTLGIKSESSVITVEMAKEIRDWMLKLYAKGKEIKIFVKNKNDMFELATSFQKTPQTKDCFRVKRKEALEYYAVYLERRIGI